MFLADCHMHTAFSPDADDTMSAMAKSSFEKGASHICFTDHIDDCSINDPVSIHNCIFQQWEERAAEYARVRDEYEGRMEIRLGGEVSSVNHLPDRAKELYENYGFDFVIGSLHSLCDTDDFYFMHYSSFEQCRDLNERYFKEYIDMARIGYFDVLGHIGYTKRYMSRDGFPIDTMEYSGYLEEIFKTIIPKGLGIEVNTSGLRDALREPIPPVAAVKLYREMGGEVITVGSDSHCVKDACAGIKDVYGVLRDIGFKYVTVFKEHKPEFIKL